MSGKCVRDGFRRVFCNEYVGTAVADPCSLSADTFAEREVVRVGGGADPCIVKFLCELLRGTR